eukprot:15471937-Alexandrium_andersonii.AAC.1
MARSAQSDSQSHDKEYTQHVWPNAALMHHFCREAVLYINCNGKHVSAHRYDQSSCEHVHIDMNERERKRQSSRRGGA